MAEWKFGTILHRPMEGETYAMVIGRNASRDGTISTTDNHRGVGVGEWIGLTLRLSDWDKSGGGPWGAPCDTTWLLDDQWVVVE